MNGSLTSCSFGINSESMTPTPLIRGLLTKLIILGIVYRILYNKKKDTLHDGQQVEKKRPMVVQSFKIKKLLPALGCTKNCYLAYFGVLADGL